MNLGQVFFGTADFLFTQAFPKQQLIHFSQREYISAIWTFGTIQVTFLADTGRAAI